MSRRPHLQIVCVHSFNALSLERGISVSPKILGLNSIYFQMKKLKFGELKASVCYVLFQWSTGNAASTGPAVPGHEGGCTGTRSVADVNSQVWRPCGVARSGRTNCWENGRPLAFVPGRKYTSAVVYQQCNLKLINVRSLVEVLWLVNSR